MSETQMTTTDAPAGPAPTGNRFAQAHLILLYFFGAILVIWLLSGFYQVQADQIAIVERLGQYVTFPNGKAATIEHGLHYHLPWPIDRVHVVSVQQRLTMTVKAFNVSPAEYDDFKREYMNNPDNPFAGNPQAMNAIFNPYLIAADKSVLHMEIAVSFRVRDPEMWLNAVSHDYHETYDSASKSDMRNQLLQQIAQRAMIAQTARLPFATLLLENRETLPTTLSALVTQGMVIHPADEDGGDIDMGIEVLRVDVTALRPPDAIKPYYDNVLSQRVARDMAKSNARTDADSMLTQARGEKETLVLDASAYKTTTIQAANGEAERFSQVLAQYRNAPDVTRWNLYVDAVTSVTGNAKRIFFAHPGQRTYIELDPAQYDPNQAKSGTGK